MSNKHRIPVGGERRLRDRALSWERQQEESQYTRRNGKPQAHTLLPDLALLHDRPFIAEAVTQRGVLPSFARSASKIKPRITRAHAMHRHGGELAFLRLSLRELDGLPLRAPETVKQARGLVADFLSAFAPAAIAYDVALQRGELEGTHVHVLLPLAFLTAPLQAAARNHRAGKGGGAEVLPGLHVCRVANTRKDRGNVAAYMGREPDARLGLEDPSSAAYLDALEELLQHRASGKRSQLTWKRLPSAWS